MITTRGRRGPAAENPAAVAALEALYEPRYSTKTIATATATMRYFDTSGALFLTNVEKQFAIASPKFFEIYETNWKTPKGTAIADLARLGENSFIVLTVGSKDYLTLPFRLIPHGTYIFGTADVGAAAPTQFAWGYGWPSFFDRYPLWVHEEFIDPDTKLRTKTGNKLPIVLPPEQRFLMTANMDTTIALTASVDVMWILWGTLYREVQ